MTKAPAWGTGCPGRAWSRSNSRWAGVIFTRLYLSCRWRARLKALRVGSVGNRVTHRPASKGVNNEVTVRSKEMEDWTGVSDAFGRRGRLEPPSRDS